MKATLAVLALLAAPVATTRASDTPRSAKPNILLIVADDLGYGDIGVHGGKAVPTPNIDKLAKSGIRCTNGYVSAPYCSPSRAGLLTGRYQTRFGHEFNPHVGPEGKLGLPLDQQTLANLLRSVGYATGIVGKWHLGFSKDHHPQSRGFDEFFGFLVGGHNYLWRKDAEPKFKSSMSQNVIHRGREIEKLDGFATDVFTDEAIDFMKRHKDRPWFLYLAYNAAHTPLEISDKVADRIPADVKDPARRGYLSLLMGLDDSIGRILAYLQESGADRNTLIVFISDNGGSGLAPFLAYNTGINRPLRGNKGQTLEGGIRVPFFVSWPGKLPAGKTYDRPVIALDVLPTACALAGVKTPKNVDGVNLMPYLLGENKAAPHDALFWRFGPQKAIRKDNWTLVDWRDFDKKTNSGWQLFDLATDIGQQNDVAAKHPDVVGELSQAWTRWNTQNIAPLWHGSPVEDPTAPAPASGARRQAAPQLVAHRGLFKHAPENTIAAFAACLSLRCGFELDVRRTKDGHLVCMHDADVRRTTDGSGKVSDLTLAELRRLDAGGWFDSAFAGERIPTLAEVFALVKGTNFASLLIALDIKVVDETLAGDIAKLAKQHGLAQQLVCIGEAIPSAELRRRLRGSESQLGIAVLAQKAEELEAALAEKDANWIYVRFMPTPEQSARIHQAGKRIFLVGPFVAGNEPENWQRARDAGVDAVLTDYPLACREIWRTTK